MTEMLFVWPCKKRKPHAPHMKTCVLHGDNHEHCTKGVCGDLQCPGVRAHPRTMIGGNFKPEQIRSSLLEADENTHLVEDHMREERDMPHWAKLDPR